MPSGTEAGRGQMLVQRKQGQVLQNYQGMSRRDEEIPPRRCGLNKVGLILPIFQEFIATVLSPEKLTFNEIFSTYLISL